MNSLKTRQQLCRWFSNFSGDCKSGLALSSIDVSLVQGKLFDSLHIYRQFKGSVNSLRAVKPHL